MMAGSGGTAMISVRGTEVPPATGEGNIEGLVRSILNASALVGANVEESTIAAIVRKELDMRQSGIYEGGALRPDWSSAGSSLTMTPEQRLTTLRGTDITDSKTCENRQACRCSNNEIERCLGQSGTIGGKRR